MASGAVLSEADLHGLVDGCLDPDRQAEVLRRAAVSPRDRALVEAWQDQNDLIRAAFSGIGRDPPPRTTEARLAPYLRSVVGTPLPRAAAKRPIGRRHAGLAATAAAIAAGLAASWYLATAQVPVTAIAGPPASDAERILADRTVASLAFNEGEAPAAAAVVEPPVITAIPDLSTVGFAFVGADARSVGPRSLVLRYRDPAGRQVALGAMRVAEADRDPAKRGAGWVWRADQVAYALYGTLTSDRLHALADALRAETRPE